MARLILEYIKLPLRFWGFIIKTAYYLRNRILIRLDGKSPEEAFMGRKISISHIRIFKYIIYAHISKEIRGKLELIARKTIFIGYLPILK
jgi:hypothetical protein